MEPRMKTWDDIEERAWVDPMLHQVVRMVEIGHCPREEALIQAALGYSTLVDELRARLLDELNRKPFSALILPRE